VLRFEYGTLACQIVPCCPGSGPTAVLRVPRSPSRCSVCSVPCPG